MSIISYIREVKAETKNIKWPTKKQITGYTSVIILMSLLLAVYIGALDVFFSKLLSIVLN